MGVLSRDGPRVLFPSCDLLLPRRSLLGTEGGVPFPLTCWRFGVACLAGAFSYRSLRELEEERGLRSYCDLLLGLPPFGFLSGDLPFLSPWSLSLDLPLGSQPCLSGGFPLLSLEGVLGLGPGLVHLGLLR